eukprot:TRINITY_DN367_c0_g6_i2.p1 TRINITY_DN367_c0_g6~~TRINITY_DN367_c0_g6_i2.p1  ORF type:complete len:324 (+),score=53.29 TRINITY_DN367_c0_g6_i2:2005-2976(+)
MTRIVQWGTLRRFRRYQSTKEGKDVKQEEKTKVAQGNKTPVAGLKPVRRKTRGEVQTGPRFQALYGEKGWTEDTVDRMDEVAKEVRGGYVSSDPNTKDIGRGPKPQWTFLDAPPKGWWPVGEWQIGAPPDDTGRPATPSNMMHCPSKVVKHGKSSTDRSKEARDVWLADMGPHMRLAMAISRRLTKKERDKVRFVQSISLLLIILFSCILASQLYVLYKRWVFLTNTALNSEDYKLRLIANQLKTVESVRGKEFTVFLTELWETFPVPNELEAEMELVWRECIKKGWIKLGEDEEHFIAEPFKMKYIQPKGVNVTNELLTGIQ